MFATKRLKRNAKRRQRNLNALKKVAVNVALHAKRTRVVKTKISRRNVHASPKQMKERNAKVQLKARRKAIVSAKMVKPNRQFQNQALYNLWLVYQPNMASGKKSIPVRNAAVIVVTIAVAIAATTAVTAATIAATIAATTVAAIAAASLVAVVTAASHAAAAATSAAAPVVTAVTAATTAHAAAAAAAVKSLRHNSIPLLWLLLLLPPLPARNTTEVQALSLRLK